MKVPPGGPRLPEIHANPLPSSTTRRASALSPEQEEQQKLMKRAREAREDSDREIEMTERHLREAQQQSAEELDRIRNAQQEEVEAEMSRQSASFRELQQEGYQKIAALKRRQSEELARVRREGEQVLAETQRHFQDSLGRAEAEGRTRLHATLDRNAQQQMFEDLRGKDSIAFARQGHEERLRSMKDSNDAKYAELRDQQDQSMAQARENLAVAREQSRTAFEGSYQDLAKNQQDALDALNARSSNELRRIREDSSEKLAAYEERQEDPFYKLRTFDATLDERDDAYILRARVPEHERKNISVSVQADRVTLTGSRRNIEKIEQEPGRTQSTASYQSITETFPISFPVDSRAISRTFDGEDLVVTIPKKAAYGAERKPYKAPVERSRAERPEFPENIPLVQRDRSATREPASSERHRLSEGIPLLPSTRRPGGRTLG